MLLAIIVFGISALADSSSSEALENVLKEVRARQESVKTLQADFHQEKSLDLLAETQTSTGTFVFEAPDKVRWDYDGPNEIVMVIAEGRLTTWYPNLAKAETLEVTRFQDRIFKYMGAGSAIDELSSFFNFRFTENRRSDSYRLDLKPKTQQVESRVRKITIWIDRETYLTSRVEYVEGDGDTTLYEFSNIRINELVDPGRFELKLSEDVRVDQIRLD